MPALAERLDAQAASGADRSDDRRIGARIGGPGIGIQLLAVGEAMDLGTILRFDPVRVAISL